MYFCSEINFGLATVCRRVAGGGGCAGREERERERERERGSCSPVYFWTCMLKAGPGQMSVDDDLLHHTL